MTEYGCLTVRILNLGSNWSDDDEHRMMEELSETLESYFHQKK